MASSSLLKTYWRLLPNVCQHLRCKVFKDPDTILVPFFWLGEAQKVDLIQLPGELLLKDIEAPLAQNIYLRAGVNEGVNLCPVNGDINAGGPTRMKIFEKIGSLEMSEPFKNSRFGVLSNFGNRHSNRVRNRLGSFTGNRRNTSHIKKGTENVSDHAFNICSLSQNGRHLLWLILGKLSNWWQSFRWRFGSLRNKGIFRGNRRG
ncbi:hypothetical protein RUND412_010588 [Rhizina undulata]